MIVVCDFRFFKHIYSSDAYSTHLGRSFTVQSCELALLSSMENFLLEILTLLDPSEYFPTKILTLLTPTEYSLYSAHLSMSENVLRLLQVEYRLVLTLLRYLSKYS